MTDVFGEDQIKKFRVIFEQFDANGDGDISAKELKGALRMLGQKADTKSCKKMIKVYDQNKTKRMEFKEFLDMMANVFQYHLSHPEDQNEAGSKDVAKASEATGRLDALFSSLDEDESGFIDAEEIIKLTEKLGEAMDLNEVRELIKQIDTDGNGQIDKEEFKKLMSAK